eukprot:6197398-Pleurochrysis_carterae.AAC.1
MREEVQKRRRKGGEWRQRAWEAYERGMWEETEKTARARCAEEVEKNVEEGAGRYARGVLTRDGQRLCIERVRACPKYGVVVSMRRSTDADMCDSARQVPKVLRRLLPVLFEVSGRAHSKLSVASGPQMN